MPVSEPLLAERQDHFMRYSPKKVPVQQHSLPVRDGCGASASAMVLSSSLLRENSYRQMRMQLNHSKV